MLNGIPSIHLQKPAPNSGIERLQKCCAVAIGLDLPNPVDAQKIVSGARTHRNHFAQGFVMKNRIRRQIGRTGNVAPQLAQSVPTAALRSGSDGFLTGRGSRRSRTRRSPRSTGQLSAVSRKPETAPKSTASSPAAKSCR